MNLFEKVVVVGCAGAGKSTLAAKLAGLLSATHIERDALGPEGSQEYRANVEAAIHQDRWVFDGAPYWVEHLVYPQADLVLALDYKRSVVMRRVLRRSLVISLTGRTRGAHLDSRWRAWLDQNHPARWAWTSWKDRHGEIRELASLPLLTHAVVSTLSSPAEAERYLLRTKGLLQSERH